MLKSLTKKEMIFQQYAENLKMLCANNLINKATPSVPVYICPICLKEFTSGEQKDNPLTSEHVPPEALGGKANILTCATCNNESGYKIDAHLVERLRQIDNERLKPGTEMKVKVNIDREIFRGTIIVEDDGTLKIHHSIRNNHPKKLEDAMKTVKGGMKLDADFWRRKVIPENLEYALLKTGYLKVFEKLGYSLIMDNCFDEVRKQIQNPDERVYPENFWLTPQYGKEMEGVYFVTTSGFECLLAMFNLNTGQSERLFATILPTPIRPVSEVISKLQTEVEKTDNIELSLYPNGGAGKDYLENIENIKAMFNWIEKRKAIPNS